MGRAFPKSFFPLMQCSCVIVFSLIEALIQNSILNKLKLFYAYQKSKKSDDTSCSNQNKEENVTDIFNGYDIIDCADDLNKMTIPMIIVELLILLFLGSTGKVSVIPMIIHIFSIIFFIFHTRKTFSFFPLGYIITDYSYLRKRHILLLISSIVTMIFGLVLLLAEIYFW